MFVSANLAIIIPAYKSNYLSLALQSLASQTDRRFNLYIGDDSSPEDLEKICQSFQNQLLFTYKKFEQNLGGTSLVQQWHRCIKLSKDEPWIWIFSDDDVIEPQCIEKFYEALEKNKSQFDVYRYNIDWIDGNGSIIYRNPLHPEIESAYDFAVQKLRFERHSTACEYIFSRKAFEREGGIVEFPLAWFSDDASWIAFSKFTGIYTIQGPKVFWRYSGLNISSENTKNKVRKLEATMMYLGWLNQWMETMKIRNAKSDEALKQLQKEWLRKQLQVFNSYLTFSECSYIASQSISIWNDPYLIQVFKYLLFNVGEFKRKNFSLDSFKTIIKKIYKRLQKTFNFK